MELNEILDVIQGGKLEEQDKSWLEEAVDVLAKTDGQLSNAKVVADILNTKPFVNPAEFLSNTAANAEHDNDFQISYEDNEALSKVEFVNENGEITDFSEEIVNLAKLELAVETAEEAEPLTSYAYQVRLSEKMKEILAQMPVNQAAQSDGGQNISDAQLGADGVANLFNPNFNGRVQIKADQGLGALFAERMGNIADKGQTLAQKYGQALVDAYGEKGKTFFTYLTNKFNKLDSQLEEKLGKHYTKPKAVVQQMIKDGSWKEAALGIGLGAVAFAGAGTAIGVGASAGLTLMTANMTRKRCVEFYKKFKKEKKEAEEKEQDLTFWKFAGRNKKEIARIVLYSCATVAGASAFVSQVNALSNAGSAMGAAAASAAQKASMSKMVLMTSGTATPFASDAAANYSRYLKSGDEADKKAAKKALKKTLSIVGMAGLTYLAVSAFSAGDAHAAETGNDGIAPENGTPAPETDAPAPEANGSEADGSDVGDQNQDTGDQNQGADDQNAADPATNADGSQYAVEPAGDKEMAIYTRNLKLVPGHEEMIENINSGLVQIPDGMSPEEAINIARIQALNYGDKSLLIALKDCDGVTIDMREALYNLHNNSWTELDGVHRLGDRKDFIGDNCRRGVIKGVNCDDVKIVSHNTCKPVVYNNEQIDLTEQKPHVTSPVDTPSTPAQHDTPMHVNSANELVTPKPVEQIAEPAPEQPAPEQPKAPKGGHYNNENEYYNDIHDGKPAPQPTGRTYTVKGRILGGR